LRPKIIKNSIIVNYFANESLRKRILNAEKWKKSKPMAGIIFTNSLNYLIINWQILVFGTLKNTIKSGATGSKFEREEK